MLLKDCQAEGVLLHLAYALEACALKAQVKTSGGIPANRLTNVGAASGESAITLTGSRPSGCGDERRTACGTQTCRFFLSWAFNQRLYWKAVTPLRFTTANRMGCHKVLLACASS